MLFKKLISKGPAALVLVLTLASAGCGRPMSGIYRGAMTLAVNGQTVVTQNTVSLNENGQGLAGSIQNAYGTWTLTGVRTSGNNYNITAVASGGLTAQANAGAIYNPNYNNGMVPYGTNAYGNTYGAVQGVPGAIPSIQYCMNLIGTGSVMSSNNANALTLNLASTQQPPCQLTGAVNQ